MKQAAVNDKLGVACVIAVLLAMGIFTFRREQRTVHPTPVKPVSEKTIESLPIPAGKTPVDKEIARWLLLTQRNEREDRFWVNLGDALMQKARETMDGGYYGQAEKAYRKALELNPKQAGAITGMAWVYGARHEFERSIEWANRAIALDPKNNLAYGLLSDAEIEMGDYEAAFDHSQKMLDLRPDISSYSRGAHLLHLTGDTKRAAMLMSKAINVGAPFAENTAWCRAQLALILLADGMVAPAEQILTDALRKTPENIHLQMAMGRVKAARKDYPAAIAHFRKAADIAPCHEAIVALGDLYQVTGKPKEAEAQYALVEKIHKLNQANGVRGDLQLAQFYADHDRNLPEALRMAEAEAATRKSVYALDTLAWCYYRNGQYDRAEAAIQKALKQRTPEARFHYHAGMIYAKQDRPERAKQHLASALNLNGHFHPIEAPMAAKTLRDLGRIFAKNGQVTPTEEEN